MSESIKHHFIPQWQLKFWADKNNRVISIDRRDKNQIRAFVTHTKNIFSHDYLYSVRDENGKNDDTLEKQIYGPLDNNAKILPEKIVSSLNRGETPNMNKELRMQFWQFHFYNAFKRHPDSMIPYLEKLDYSALRQESIQTAINSGEDEKIIRQTIEKHDLKNHIKKKEDNTQGLNKTIKLFLS